MAEENGRALPKFGEWDVNDPASADGFTVIFNKARDEKKQAAGSAAQDAADSPTTTNHANKNKLPDRSTSQKKWFCCVTSSPTQT